MANAGALVMLAAKAARDKVIEVALTGRNAPFAGAAADDVLVNDGRLALATKNVNITYAELLAPPGTAEIAANFCTWSGGGHANAETVPLMSSRTF
jgi:hypothetical protein